MRNWIAKLRISARLDSGKPLSAAQRRALARSAELRRFLEHTEAFGPALRQATPPPESPAGLHADIMRAVRAAKPESASSPALRASQFLFPHFRTAAAGAVLVLAVASAWWWHQHQTPRVVPAGASAAPLAAAAQAFDLGREAARTMPATVMAPLTDELDRLNQDLTNTAQFLLASLP